jgi:hypothetical protein
MRFLRFPLVALALALPLSTSSCWLFSPTGLDGFVEAFLRANCHFAFTCCTPPERAQFFPSTFRDEGACVNEGNEEGSGANVVVDRAKAVIAVGKGEFDQARADECLKPVLDQLNSCDAEAVLAGGGLDARCAAEQARAFVVGNVDDGDDCNDDIECANFGFCDRSDNDDDVVTTAGECKESVDEGGDCSENPSCFPGLVCVPNEDFTEFTCEEVELKDNGEDCFGNGECASNFCESSERFECSGSGDPCTEETVLDDCPVGEFCFEQFSSVCADSDVSVEVCDGQ